jgi:hypothetical protein
MEALNGLFRRADQNNMFSSLQAPAIKHRLPLYADNLVIFLSLEAKDVRLTRAMVEFFAGASGLHTNLTKCQLTPIRCTEEQIACLAMVSLPVGQFLVQILGCATVNLQAQEERLDSIGGCSGRQTAYMEIQVHVTCLHGNPSSCH